MRSFGINLITTLTTQLEGDLELKGSNGVSVSILFRRKEA
jgi:two-component sensor histidine kinase